MIAQTSRKEEIVMKEITIGQAAALTSPDPLVLVCTKKADGSLNMAPVSFFMFASFKPPKLAFAMGGKSCSGENVRRDGRAVIAVPAESIAAEVMRYGTVHGQTVDKLAQAPVELACVEGTDIGFPAESKVVFAVSLDQTVEVGDHFLYICSVDKVYGDETKEALFAWNGYAQAAPAKKG